MPKEATGKTLIPELAKRREGFEAVKRDARDLTDGLTHEQFNWRPASDEWSIGQCLSHLNVAGFLILQRMEEAIEKARREGPFAEGPFQYGFLGRWFIRSLEPDFWLRMPAPAPYMPTADHNLEVVVPRFISMQNDLVAAVEASQGLDLERIWIGSPVSRLIRHSLGVWLAATEAHERRHMAQARRVKEDDAFPG